MDHGHVALPARPGRELGDDSSHVVVPVTSEEGERLDAEDDGRENGEVVVLEVECGEGGAEGEGGGEGGEGVPGEKEGGELLESSHGGWEVGQLGIGQVKNCEVWHGPELWEKRERELVK